jgi:hypothetical protein
LLAEWVEVGLKVSPAAEGVEYAFAFRVVGSVLDSGWRKFLSMSGHKYMDSGQGLPTQGNVPEKQELGQK